MKIFLFFCLFFYESACAQLISASLPQPLSKHEKYLFYLHGGVVTVLGNNAINRSVPEWGPYEYLNILDSLRIRGFNIISERRLESISDSIYIEKLYLQVDSLLKQDIDPANILVVGASAGWHIAIHAAAKLKDNRINFVMMGGCWPETYKDYTHLELYGRFLSIIETSDRHGTCVKIFESRNFGTRFKEIILNTGLSHGFFYKGRRAWIDPLLDWYSR